MRKLSALALVLVLPPALAIAAPEFSRAHTQLKGYFEAQPLVARAMWPRYNYLVLGTTANKHAKTLAKAACKHLNRHGFANLGVEVSVVDYRTLRQDNSWKELDHRQCQP